MRRREFTALLGASVTWPFAAMAQEPGRTYRLGFLEPALVDRKAPTSMAFFNELRSLGFVEDRNLTLEYRAYGQHIDLIPQYAAELLSARVDVITVAGIGATALNILASPLFHAHRHPKFFNGFREARARARASYCR